MTSARKPVGDGRAGRPTGVYPELSPARVGRGDRRSETRSGTFVKQQIGGLDTTVTQATDMSNRYPHGQLEAGWHQNGSNCP